MSVNFIPNITWSNNPELLSAKNYDIKTPPGLGNTNVRKPLFVDVPGMEGLTRQGAAKGDAGQHSGRVNGLVTKDIKIRFEDTHRQWRCTPVGGTGAKCGPGSFKFQGGSIFLDLILGIYIFNVYQPTETDEISKKLFALLYGHELLHVWDEIDILNNIVMKNLTEQPLIKRYLVNGEPFIYGNNKQIIAQIEREFHPLIQDRIETEVFNLKSEESDKRQKRRDSPTEYKAINERVMELQSQR